MEGKRQETKQVTGKIAVRRTLHGRSFTDEESEHETADSPAKAFQRENACIISKRSHL